MTYGEGMTDCTKWTWVAKQSETAYVKLLYQRKAHL